MNFGILFLFTNVKVSENVTDEYHLIKTVNRYFIIHDFCFHAVNPKHTTLFYMKITKDEQVQFHRMLLT